MAGFWDGAHETNQEIVKGGFRQGGQPARDRQRLRKIGGMGQASGGEGADTSLAGGCRRPDSVACSVTAWERRCGEARGEERSPGRALRARGGSRRLVGTRSRQLPPFLVVLLFFCGGWASGGLAGDLGGCLRSALDHGRFASLGRVQRGDQAHPDALEQDCRCRRSRTGVHQSLSTGAFFLPRLRGGGDDSSETLAEGDAAPAATDEGDAAPAATGGVDEEPVGSHPAEEIGEIGDVPPAVGAEEPGGSHPTEETGEMEDVPPVVAAEEIAAGGDVSQAELSRESTPMELSSRSFREGLVEGSTNEVSTDGTGTISVSGTAGFSVKHYRHPTNNDKRNSIRAKFEEVLQTEVKV